MTTLRLPPDPLPPGPSQPRRTKSTAMHESKRAKGDKAPLATPAKTLGSHPYTPPRPKPEPTPERSRITLARGSCPSDRPSSPSSWVVEARRI